jgi:hypothetical protein
VRVRVFLALQKGSVVGLNDFGIIGATVRHHVMRK